MNIGKILRKVGSGLIREIPGADAVIGVVNAFLPDDKKLPENATGDQVRSAVDSLPPDQRAAVMSKEFDVRIAEEEGWTDRYVAMTKADGQTTRPAIALMMARVLCIEILAFTVWCFLHPDSMSNPVLWTVFASLTATPAALLAKYFGELRREQGQRLGVKERGLLERIIR